VVVEFRPKAVGDYNQLFSLKRYEDQTDLGGEIKVQLVGKAVESAPPPRVTIRPGVGSNMWSSDTINYTLGSTLLIQNDDSLFHAIQLGAGGQVLSLPPRTTKTLNLDVRFEGCASDPVTRVGCVLMFRPK
jgi:hypothetical protein